MAHFNFVIPGKKEELLSETDAYYVKNVVVQRELLNQLKDARTSERDEGAEFILDYFDVFYSVLHHGDSLPMDVIFKSYQDLHKAATDLNNSLGFLLEDTSSINDELKQKYQNIMKMLVYVYTQTVLLIEHKNEVKNKNQGLLKGRKKPLKDDLTFGLDKKNILLTLNNIIQREIALFWDPPVAEENFLNIVAEVCYKFLQNSSVKCEKEVRQEIFNLIGTLIKTYNHGTTFAIRMAQMIKCEEHLVQCLSEGVQQLVDTFNCKGLIHALVREITEWQTDEKFQDSQGSRYCAQLLTSMAVLMPNLMIPELLYLNKYLNHESATLRNSVLNVITEVIINVLTKHSLTEEDIESRDDFLTILLEHMDDTSAHVRSRVMHHWARLQKENAIPRKLVNDVLEKVIEHLEDKAALVRKSAANCVTTFLSSNTYSAELSLLKMQAELENNERILNSIKSQVDEVQMAKIEEMEAQWNAKVPELQKVLEEELQKEEDDEETDDTENGLPKNQQLEMIRLYLNENKYKEAFQLCKASGSEHEDFEEFRENNRPNAGELYLFLLKSIYINPLKLLEEMRQGVTHGAHQMSEDDFRKFEVLQEKVEYLKEAVTFLKLIDNAITPMTELLETTAISDMQEAVEFFISAYQFNIDNALRGIMAMLQIMQRNEQDRKDMIIEAFKTIYLKTDANNMQEHCTTVVNRLISFLKSVPTTNLDDLELIISEWVAKGILDNSVIDMLWQYFTKKSQVTDEDCHASVELLRMAALSRRTIITRNIKLVTTIAFGEMGEKNLAFLGSACEFLSVAGRDRIDITSKDPPFKIKPDDQVFKDLFGILLKHFFEPVEFYHRALLGGIDFVYKLCGKPEKLCEDFIRQILEKLTKNSADSEDFHLDRFVYMRLCQLLGIMALKHLDYLDETVYKELKRREHIRSQKQTEKNKGSTKKNKKDVNKNLRKSAITNQSGVMHNTSLMGNNMSSVVEESNLEGAQAEDSDAEFILNVLENSTVSSSSGLGKLAYFIKNICERPDVYNDVMLQGAAVTAIIRYMLVSSQFCNQNIQLLFTIFEKTDHSEIKVSILVHLSDLLTRFPNIIEPWTPRIYERLKDPSDEIRKATFFTLSSLILRDMIRAHSYISQMVNCLVDEDKELCSMGRTFFVTLSHKENNLYNVLPDIFSHLMETKDVTEENIRDIMKFLFDLMDKTKHMENLVDRFCAKFLLSEDIRHHKNIAYCLTLIQYNEKALKKLQENFSMYKHLVHDADVYASFKSILQSCSKQQVGKVDLKPLVAEIEKNINSVFELNEEGRLMKAPPPPKSTKKSKSRTGTKRKPTRKQSANDSDSEDEIMDSSNTQSNSVSRKSSRARKEKRVIEESDSD